MSELRVEEIELTNLQNDAGDTLLSINSSDGGVTIGDNVEGVSKALDEWTIATRPTAVVGKFGFNTELGYKEIWNGYEWQVFNENGVAHKGLIIHCNTHDIDSYEFPASVWSSTGRFAYSFDGNASDITVNNGIISGTTWRARRFNGTRGKQEQALNQDHHSIFFSIRFNGTGTYPNGYSGSWNKIFSHTGSSGDRSPGVWRFPSQRRIHWRYNPSNTGTDFGKNSAGNDFDLDQWYHVGVTKNGAATVNYVNGVQVSTSSVANPKQAGNSNIDLFPGYPADLANLNDLFIYNRPITAAEALQNFNSLRDKYGI